MKLLKNALKKLRNKIIPVETIKDIESLTLLQPLIKDYLPYSCSAIRPSALVAIANDITVNNRQCIVELGGGISTILLSNLLSSLEKKRKLITIEHDAEWLEVLENILKSHGDLSRVDLVYAQLDDCEYSLLGNKWYQKDVIKDNLKKYGKIDCLIIDGPPAYQQGYQFSRYSAIPFFSGLLSDNCSVFLDDGNRDGEKKIVSLWEKNYSFNFKDIGGNMLMATRGSTWNIL